MTQVRDIDAQHLVGHHARVDEPIQIAQPRHALTEDPVGLKEGDQVLRARFNGYQRTLYLQENRLVGYQLIGDIRAAGALRTLLLQGENLAKIKDLLLEPTFGQGVLIWKSLTPHLS